MNISKSYQIYSLHCKQWRCTSSGQLGIVVCSISDRQVRQFQHFPWSWFRLVRTFGTFKDSITIKTNASSLQRCWINSHARIVRWILQKSKMIAASTPQTSQTASATLILVLVGWLIYRHLQLKVWLLPFILHRCKGEAYICPFYLVDIGQELWNYINLRCHMYMLMHFTDDKHLLN